ncbi:MAG: caspase family protein [Acidobacteria bacterium]|nr:caspase family protein [Acidobacteriota bacterium]
MPKGIALTLGLNAVDPKHYGGWTGDLNACEADAEDLAEIATAQGFQVKTLLTKAATRTRVIKEITAAARSLKAGDIFMLTYSGHGGQLPDENNDENDGQDETWCLFDGELVDDELYKLWSKFAAGVRVLVLSDSCHSGSVTKQAYYRAALTAAGAGASSTTRKIKYRFMPPDAALRTYRKNRAFYDAILKQKDAKPADVKATILLLSGCMDNQLSSDGDFNGLFTANLLRVWNDSKFKKGYRAFHQAIIKRMPPEQTPNFFVVGAANAAYEAQTPFTV